jgi:hemolysin activation/secretion protein
MKIRQWLTPFFLLCGEIVSTQLNAQEPSTEQPRSSKGLNAIFLTGNPDEVIPDGRPDLEGIYIGNIDIPCGAEDLAVLLAPFLGQPMTRKTAIGIKQTIMTYYVDRGIKMIGVELPPQKTRGGVVQFLVRRKYFRQAIFKGESLFDEDELMDRLGVHPCTDLSEYDLQNNLSWLNKNPFSNTKMRYRPTDDIDFMDIEFVSKKRFPIRVYARGSNTGSASTGYGRLYAGFAWGDAFWRGDILSFEFNTSNEFKRLQRYTGNYTCYLPWQHILYLYGSYSTVKPKSPTSRVTAHSWIVYPRYSILFKPLFKPLQQSISFEFDIKNTNSSIFNLSNNAGTIQPAAGRGTTRNEIYVSQFLFNYSSYNSFRVHSTTFVLYFALAPFKFLPHQTKRDYNRVRFHSDPQYCYLNVTVGDVITIPNRLTIAILLRGQIASQPLPSTELFTIGGFDTVRGYHDGAVSTDNGFIANLELRTPYYKVYPCRKGRLLFLAFVDYGVSNDWFIRQSRRPGAKHIPHTISLLGVGPGMRYDINPYFQFRCDYGFKLHHLFANSKSLGKLRGGFGQWHVGALASY